MTQCIQAILIVLSLVNPAIFAKVPQGQSRSEKIANATKAALAILLLLCLAALAGAQLLRVLGISLPAFKVAGGMVLVWMGFIMLHGSDRMGHGRTVRFDGSR